MVTGAMLAEQGLAWMPTLSNDVQAVLATDKVRFQGQEVAFVVAEDRYAARDALELIDVEYDVLPPVIDVRKALDPDAPVIRDDLEGKTDNHCFDWETGDEAATEAVFARGRRRGQPGHRLPARAPGADGDLRRGRRLRPRSTASSRSGRRRRRRTPTAPLYALVAGLPEHKIRVISPDIGGGFGNKVPIYPGYVCAIVGSMRHRQAGEVDGGPLREPGQHRLRPRLRHAGRDRGDPGRQDPGDPHQRARRPRRLQRHGRAGEVPGRLLRGLHRQLRPRGRVLHDDRGLHQQGTRRCRLRLLVPDHRGRLPRRADGRLPRRRAGHGPGRAAAEELHPARAVPVHHQDRLGVRLRQLRARPCARRWTSPATTSCGASRRRSGPGAS